MGCNCKIFEIIIAVIVFVFVMWPEMLGTIVSKWIVAIVAIALFVHALKCKNCGSCKSEMNDMPMKKSSSATKKKRK